MSDNLAHNLASRIGCHCWGTNEASVNAVPTFAKVGCRWIRATRPMQMEVVSTGPRKYNFGDAGERSIDLAVASGMSIMAILDGRWGNETRINKLPFASPIWEHLDLWEDFVTAAVSHYKSRVKFWEVINEPPFFWWYPTPAGVVMPEYNAALQRAPIQAYANLLKATARAVRAVDPTAQIVVGSGFPDGYFLKHLYDLGAKDDFDIASVHYLNCRHPEDFGRGHACVRHVMAEAGDGAKALWDTENGPSGAVIGCAVQTPGEYEAIYNIYRHCLAHQFGLERYFWFNPVDRTEAGVAPELGVSCYDAHGTLVPAYRAMQTLTTLVGDGELLAHAHPDREVHAYVFAGAAGPVSVLWATAPASVRLRGRAVEATTFVGETTQLPAEFALTGRPLFIQGNVLRDLDVTVTGRRETVAPCWENKRVNPLAPRVASPRVTSFPGWDDAAWASIPPVATRDQVSVTAQQNHFCLVSTSVSAELQLAHDDAALYLRARTYDDRLDPKAPTGLVQFTFRNQDPEVAEWSFFFNSYALFNLFASDHGTMLLRFDPLYADQYPSGVVRAAEIRSRAAGDGLVFVARIPWDEIGPVRPGRHNPAYMMFMFSRADNLLNVPKGETPEEWSHNFADNFIVKPPALTRWVEFR